MIHDLAITLFASVVLTASPSPDTCRAWSEAGCFANLREAVAAAAPGATVHALAGRFDEHLVIDKPLTLAGGAAGAGVSVLRGRITATRAITLAHFDVVGWITTREHYALDDVRIGAWLPPLVVTPPAAADMDDIAPTRVRRASPPSDTAAHDNAAFVPPRALDTTGSAATDPTPALASAPPVTDPWAAGLAPATGLLGLAALGAARAARRPRVPAPRMRLSHRALRRPRGWVAPALQIAADVLGEAIEADRETALVNVARAPAPAFTLSLADGRLLTFAAGRRRALRRHADARSTDLGEISGAAARDVQAIWVALCAVGHPRSAAALPDDTTWRLSVSRPSAGGGPSAW